jgi:hypothetical protein
MWPVDWYTFIRDILKAEIATLKKLSVLEVRSKWINGWWDFHAINWVEINKEKYLFEPLYRQAENTTTDTAWNIISIKQYELKECKITKFLE